MKKILLPIALAIVALVHIGSLASARMAASEAPLKNISTPALTPTPYCTPDSSLVAQYKADGDAADSSGNNNHGFFVGDAHATAPGKVNQAFGFDGNGDYVEVPNSPSLDLNNFTIEAWVKPTNLNALRTIVAKRHSTAPEWSYGVRMKSGGQLEGRITNASGTFKTVNSTGALTANVFNHIALTYNGSQLKVYINGSLQGTTSTTLIPQASNQPLRIGSWYTPSYPGNVQYWLGEIDEVSLYSRALSAQELLGIYNADGVGLCEPPAENGRIAFSSNRNGNDEIYAMNADGTGQTRLTNDPASDYFPAFSPDGAKIAFTSTRDGNAEIYLMNADGTAQTRLTVNSQADYDPSFSGDGTKIVFASERDGGNSEIYVMNADGTNQIRLTNNSGIDYQPVFSPDGTKIAFTSFRDGNWEIYAMSSDGTGQTRLTSNSAIDHYPAFSPDGARVAFTTNRDGALNYEIYVMNSDGSNQTRLTNNAARDYQAAFSSDGTKIVFASERDGGNNSEVYLMNADGTEPIRLTDNLSADRQPSWGN